MESGFCVILGIAPSAQTVQHFPHVCLSPGLFAVWMTGGAAAAFSHGSFLSVCLISVGYRCRGRTGLSHWDARVRVGKRFLFS